MWSPCPLRVSRRSLIPLWLLHELPVLPGGQQCWKTVITGARRKEQRPAQPSGLTRHRGLRLKEQSPPPVHPPPPSFPPVPQDQSPPPPLVRMLLPPPPPQHQWLHMSPDATSQWVPEALDPLFNEWSPHMDARLQQWASKHSTPEMRTTIDALVRSPMNAEKRKGLSSVLEGCRTPVRVFVNAAA